MKKTKLSSSVLIAMVASRILYRKETYAFICRNIKNRSWKAALLYIFLIIILSVLSTFAGYIMRRIGEYLFYVSNFLFKALLICNV